MTRQEIRESITLRGDCQSSNVELIAAVTGADLVTAARFMQNVGSLRQAATLTVRDLWQHHGMTHDRACALASAFELGERAAAWTQADYPAIRDPEDVAHLLRARFVNAEQELLVGLYLDTKHQVRRMVDVYRGTVCSASVRVAELIRPAITDNLPNIILAHNHPSGDPTPSPEDTSVTRRTRQAAEIHDIEVLDHVVIGARGFVSMKQRGLGFDGGTF